MAERRNNKRIASKVKRQVRATGSCITMLSWGMGLWLLQLWLAAMSIVALGAVGTFDAVSQTAAGKFALAGTSYLFAGILEAASFVLGFTVTADLFEAIPALLVMSLLLTWLVGLVTMFGVAFQSLLVGLRPLSGSGTTLKVSAVLVALIGYFVPIANLFPWFVFWVIAIWRHPR